MFHNNTGLPPWLWWVGGGKTTLVVIRKFSPYVNQRAQTFTVCAPTSLFHMMISNPVCIILLEEFIFFLNTERKDLPFGLYDVIASIVCTVVLQWSDLLGLHLSFIPWKAINSLTHAYKYVCLIDVVLGEEIDSKTVTFIRLGNFHVISC